jgi:uncharacterized protein YndB with AHSA1/START domain
MSVSVCPIAVIAAPIERVWALVVDPAQWAHWADASLDHVEPPGPACPGQTFVVSSVGFGRRWRFHFTVDAVDEAGYRLRVTARFPFGMVEHTQIGCVAVDEATCRVTFG